MAGETQIHRAAQTAQEKIPKRAYGTGKDRGRAYAGGIRTACRPPTEESETAQRMARQEESQRAAQAPDTERACQSPSRGEAPNAGGSGTAGSQQKSEEKRLPQLDSTGRNQPGSGGGACKAEGVPVRSRQKIPAENV